MNTILIAEFYLSGGSRQLASSLLLEGYAMVKAASQALTQVGLEVVVLVDERLRPYVELGPSRQVPVAPGELSLKLRRGLDAPPTLGLIIAPPTGGVHASLIEALEEAGVRHLGPPSHVVRTYLDKHRQAVELRRYNIPVPRTEVIDEASLPRLKELASSLGFPLVLKPRLGAGCEGLLVAYSMSDLEKFTSKGWIGEDYLAQEFLNGAHASTAVFSDGSTHWAPCLNAQLMKLGRSPSYEGGLTPLTHPLEEEALRVSEEAVKSLGLTGYVGVDLVLTGDGPYVVEVNPRLTTSIVSLAEVLGGGLLGSLLASTGLKGLGSLVRQVDVGNRVCAFVKARAPARLALTSLVRSRIVEASGAYVVSPLTGWVSEGEPVALVKASGHASTQALQRAMRLKAEVESMLMDMAKHGWS